MFELLLSLIILLFTAPFVLCLVDKIFGTNHSCRIFGWHDGKCTAQGVKFDGASFHAVCSKCGKEVMQDSQGGWF